MKHTQKLLSSMGLMLAMACSGTARAQNTSFNDNAIPISGTESCAFGADVLGFNKGAFNTGNGGRSLEFNTTGEFNSAFGYKALSINEFGNENTANGCKALLGTSGSNNTATGAFAFWSNTTGEENTGLGSRADVASGDLMNATALGSNAIVNASKKVRIGDVTVNVIEGQVPYSFPSDGRFNTNIKEEDVKGLEFITKLRPVVYNFDTRKFTEFLTKNMSAESRQHYLQ